MLDSLVSSWPEFDLKDTNDRPMVRGLDVRAAGIHECFYVISLPAPE